MTLFSVLVAGNETPALERMFLKMVGWMLAEYTVKTVRAAE